MQAEWPMNEGRKGVLSEWWVHAGRSERQAQVRLDQGAGFLLKVGAPPARALGRRPATG